MAPSQPVAGPGVADHQAKPAETKQQEHEVEHDTFLQHVEPDRWQEQRKFSIWIWEPSYKERIKSAPGKVLIGSAARPKQIVLSANFDVCLSAQSGRGDDWEIKSAIR